MSATAAPDAELKGAWRALWALIIGFFMIMIDTTIVSVSIPHIMSSLHAGVSTVLWVSSAYLLTYAVPLLVSGRLGDRFGPKRLYLLGLVIFTLASAWCGLAGTIGMLIAARAVQGLGASLISPQPMAVVTRLFPAHKRGAAMSVWGATSGVGTLIGPILGGVLLDAFGWPAIFWVNVPIGILGLILAWRLVPDVATHPHTFDWLGVALSGVAVFCVVFGLQEGQGHDWRWWVWLLIGAGIVLFGGFMLWQARNRREPLMPLGLFRNRNFSVANVGVFMIGALITAQSFPIMLFVQEGRGLNPTPAALLTIPTAVGSLILAPVVGRITDRRDPRLLAPFGFALFAVGLGLYAALMHEQVSVLWFLLPAAINGVGSALIWGPLSVSATRELPWRLAGAGSGIYNATRQLGSVLGSAAVAALIAAQLAARMPARGGARAGAGGGMSATRLPDVLQHPFGDAMASALLLPVGAAVLGLLVTLLLRRRAVVDGHA